MPRTLARILLLTGLVAALLAGGQGAATSATVGQPVAHDQGGRVLSWGWDQVGSTVVPTGLGAHNVVAVAAGLHYSLALTEGGQVVAWGMNDYGIQSVPSGHFTAIAAGVTHALALTADGRVVAWGNNDAGQTAVPASLNGKTVTAIAAGRYTSLALTSDGKVTVWGYDEFNAMAAPDSLAGKTVTAIAASYSHALAVTSDGTVTAWGSNKQGESALPATLAGQTVTSVAAGTYTSMALTSTGNVVIWGTNDYGQHRVPGSIAGKVVGIAAGWFSAGALTDDGKVVTWGEAVPNGWVADGRHVSAFAFGVEHVVAIARSLHPTSTPTLGAAHVGKPMDAVPGTWTDPIASHTYTWRVDGHVAGGGARFTPVAAQYGKQLTLTIGATATNAEQGTAHVTTAAVTIGKGTFTTVPPPTITGKREAGHRLVASITGVDPQPDSVTFVWKRGHTVVHTGTTYYPTSSDRSLGVYATVTKHGYDDGQSLVGTGAIQGCTTAC